MRGVTRKRILIERYKCARVIERVEECLVYTGSHRFHVVPHWMLWLDTEDYVHGTYLELNDDGSINRVTVRKGEGDDVISIKGPDGA